MPVMMMPTAFEPVEAAIRSLDVALTAHHVLKTGLAQSSRQVVVFGVDSEGPKNLKGGVSAIHFEQNNFL
jgi:hypothetical protein